MRTTITLDADVAALVEREMSERGVSLEQAVNDAIRRGLPRDRHRSAETMPTFSMGQPTVLVDKALQLAGEMADKAVIAKLELRN